MKESKHIEIVEQKWDGHAELLPSNGGPTMRKSDLYEDSEDGNISSNPYYNGNDDGTLTVGGGDGVGAGVGGGSEIDYPYFSSKMSGMASIETQDRYGMQKYAKLLKNQIY